MKRRYELVIWNDEEGIRSSEPTNDFFWTKIGARNGLRDHESMRRSISFGGWHYEIYDNKTGNYYARGQNGF